MMWNGRWLNKTLFGYCAAIAGCWVLAIAAGWTLPASQFDDYVYDMMLRLNPPAERMPEAVVLAIDDATLNAMGGQRNLREILAQAIEMASREEPRVLASDILLADNTDEAEDARLEKAMSGAKNLILPVNTTISGREDRWEEPLERFRKYAAATGQVELERQRKDGVTRRISLEWVAAHRRYWALSLEAFRISRGGGPILESRDDVQTGGIVIPARRTPEYHRMLRLRYTRNPIPSVSVRALKEDPSLGRMLRGKVVFVGVTSQSLTPDRVLTPNGDSMSGVDVHAEAFETIRRGQFLRDVSDSTTLGFCAAAAALAGLIFWFAAGWPAYLSAGALLAFVHGAPFLFFSRGFVFPYVAPAAAAWLTIAAAASYQHFIVRRRLRRAEAQRARYQQAIHFVTHEMRTPLTAIQGSSELMGRYNLNDEKRKQMAGLIHTESKRLARMIQTFLDVEKLSDGQMELKHEPVLLEAAVEACLARTLPLAEKKNIAIHREAAFPGTIFGDGELIEYAIYNLLTNAVKYSPAGTEVRVFSARKRDTVSLSIADQGIGMDAKELKQIFRKFYRTKRAEATGEAGTGIGLSIVEQIVTTHGGRMEVTSEPGHGSCFTVTFPAA
jgi:signal transduction histidine kinase